ncbi:acetylglutamate kinase [Elusimicrobium posterum]|uniref:acetylglutamate kinase n=1 Tax=Elusimicrobium posterum TaxID=3116653 RepID=UPI003C79542A
MFDSVGKIETLIEAMPYIRKFQNKTVVIKYGGHAMVNDELKKKVAQDIAFLQFSGLRPIVVHGGGPEITDMLKKVGKKSEFVNGLRITDDETVDIAQMVLVGRVNTEITGTISMFDGKAIGLNGKDSKLISAEKLYSEVKENGETKEIDIGYVGAVTGVNTHLLNSLLDSGYIPIVSPIGVGENGETFNINADTVAGEIAAALHAEKLIMLTDVKGIFEDPKDPSTFVSTLTFDKAHEMMMKGTIDGGMIPKVKACINALNNMTKKAHIIDGRTPHSILMEIFTDSGSGTMVVR